MNKGKSISVRFNNYLNRLIEFNKREYGISQLTLERYSMLRLNESRRVYRSAL
jgi:DNA-directed RNA polymerase subunit N (RpoN/RPB10)